MKQFDWSVIPEILDFTFEPQAYEVTSAMQGLRLSVILGDNQELESLSYMEESGEALGCIVSDYGTGP